ncbi:MAG TPA: SAM-dependent methyltransferase, partial [Symbiobacteriaceae bacterium]|nr:SAM-dependent methyltransferase [Symbiobacteriaceae bacterium]
CAILKPMNTPFLMTSSPAYQRQAIAELRAVDPKAGALGPLAPEVLRFTPTLDRDAFLRAFQDHSPIFIRHLHPADQVTAPDLGAITAAVGPLLASVRPGERIAVQGRKLGREEAAGEGALTRTALKEALDALIERAGGHPVIQAPDRILSVSWDAQNAYTGLSSPAENLSDWTGGEVRFRREEEQVSRARFKLLEALARFDLRLVNDGHALDLGAAPGGWTSLLLERGMHVTAVDTGELAPTVRQHPLLTFRQENVEQVNFPPDTFDVITCDMSWNPLHTARLVARLAPAVKAGGDGILTVKLMLENPTRTIRQVTEIIAETFEVLRIKQLYHNRDEVTLHLRRRR